MSSNRLIKVSFNNIYDKKYPLFNYKKYKSKYDLNIYTDVIVPDNMSHPIMESVDKYGHKFVLIRVLPRIEYNNIKKNNKMSYEGCLTLVCLQKSLYLPPDIAKHIESYLKEDFQDDLHVITFHKCFSDDKYMICHVQGTERSNKYNNLITNLQNNNIKNKYNILELYHNPFNVSKPIYTWWDWCDNAKIDSLINGTHQKLLIM